MAFTNAHLYVRLNGGFGASVAALTDKWSTGFRVGIPTQDSRYDAPALQTFANSVHTAAQTLHSSTGMRCGTTCFFQNVSVARVGEDGKYNPAGQLTVYSVGTPTQGSQAGTQPWTASLSFGLRTAAPRGHASNGRAYYPMLAATIDQTTGRVNASEVTNRLNAFRTFINAVNTAALVYEPASGVQVMSQVGDGKSERVLALRADSRLDAIERRENDAPSSYTTVNL